MSRENWDRYCSLHRSYPSVGLSLDISRMNFGESFLKEMGAPMQKALSAMTSLEAGAIANPDEKRMVGHYWLRAPELSPTPEIRASIETTKEVITAFAADIHGAKIRPPAGGRFTNLLLIGIGGSALGPQLVSEALWTPAAKMKLHFVDNTDPDGITRTLTQIGGELPQTITIVISKSGGTVETSNGMLEVARAYSDAGLDFAKHAVAVTCPGSKLNKHAAGWIRSFEMWDWVGGRTSLFSSVGLLPAALQGIDIEQFLAGAREMDVVTREKDETVNPASLLALMWYAAGDGKGKKDMVVLPYKDRLVLFSKYLQQLVMESLGKEKDLTGKVVNQGIAVYGNKGSTDQHAYVQQLRDGVDNFFVTFIQVLEDFLPGVEHASLLNVREGVTSGDFLTGFLLGTREALSENGRSSITITIDRFDTKTLGALIALYERAVGLYASLVNINAYHQPGVEAGKKAAERVIELQQALQKKLTGSPVSAAQMAKSIGADDEVETVFKILERLCANGRAKRTGGPGPASLAFSTP